MVCALPAPLWSNNQQTGLVSAVENVVDGYVALKIGSASAVAPAQSNHYNIYYSLDVDDLFNAPKLISLDNQVSVPPTLVSLNHFLAARTAQLGISSQIASPNLVSATEDLFVYPAATTLTQDLDPGDGYVVVEDAAGYPLQDGYLLVGNEVILYSDRIDGYTDGYDGLLIGNRDPFGCNDVITHQDGYQVQLFKGFEDQNTRRFKSLGSCTLDKPTWPGEIGIKRVADAGIGTSVKLEWHEAAIPVGFSERYFNIYRTDNLSDLLKFGTLPIAFSTGTEGTIPGLSAGKASYFAVKAAYQLQNLQTSGFDLLSPGVFAWPAKVTVDEPDGYYFTSQIGAMQVSSTEGYPLRGFLQVGSEVMEYNGITSTTFNIIERDVFTMGLTADYANGEPVGFFRGIQDTNRNYYRASPSWDAGIDVPKLALPDGYNNFPADGYGGASYNQDLDGYRSFRTDDLTEDHTAFETDKLDEDLTGRCTYHRENWDDYFSRNQCGTYGGGIRLQVIPGVNNGVAVPVGGGIDVWEHATRTEEDLLGKSGDCFILLRRKWKGKKCPRLSIRSEHPHARCLNCFGTTFQGGYDRFINTRAIRQGQANPNGFIMIRVDPYDDDLELNQHEGLKQITVLNGWTISMPAVRDRDILIRYIFDRTTGLYEEEFRYEVKKTNRNRLLFKLPGKQGLELKRIDKTREIYKFSDPVPGSLPGTPAPPGFSL